MKFLFVFAQPGSCRYMNKHEAKCTLPFVQHLLLFYSLL